MSAGRGRRRLKDDFRKPLDERKTVKEIAVVIEAIPKNEAVMIFTCKGMIQV